MLVNVQIGVDIRSNQIIGLVDHILGHQKYPSCFFFSMLAA